LVSELTSSATEFKQQAAGSSKAAGAAMDKMVAAAIANGQALKESLAGGQPEVAAQVDAVLGKFVSKANELRTQLNSQQLGAGKALDEVGPSIISPSKPQDANKLLVGMYTSATRPCPASM
jgi:hypothetical protein